jgi:hypothetical protein
VSSEKTVTDARRSNLETMFNAILDLPLLVGFCPLSTIAMPVSPLSNGAAMTVTEYNQ